MAAEGARRSYGSDARVVELQRGRLLDAIFALVYELGYANVTAHKVSERAGVSNRTFYELFGDREDCFLAAFDYALEGLAAAARPAHDAERDWAARVRAGLAVLLAALDREPAVRRLVFVEALTAGPRVLARRARVLVELTAVIDAGRSGTPAALGLSALTAEATVGATFGVIHARLLGDEGAPVAGLLNGLMATIVLPYRGAKAAARELECPLPTPAFVERRNAGALVGRPLGSSSPAVDFRLTIRAQLALSAVAELSARGSHPSNREVSEQIGLHDQGQVSRLMGRMQAQGLVENTRLQTRARGKGLAKAWRLTGPGRAVLEAYRGGQDLVAADEPTAPAAETVVEGPGREHRRVGRSASRSAFRLTALTHRVLGAVAELSARGSGPSNREIAEAADVKDEGQISKLLARLQAHDLLQNAAPAHPSGGPNEWRLTGRGEELMGAVRSSSSRDRLRGAEYREAR